MKKKWVALLLLVMMAFSLVGCSSAEIGYLNQSLKAAEMTNIAFNGKIDIAIDNDKLEALTGVDLGDKNQIEVAMNGRVRADDEQMAVDMDLSYRFKDQKTFVPLMRTIMDMDNGIMYVSTAGMWQMQKDFANIQEEWPADMYNEMDAYMKAHPYIKMDLGDEYRQYVAEVKGNLAHNNLQDKVKDLYGLLTKEFDGYTTNAVVAKDGGYEITLTKDQMIDMMDSWMQYIMKNDIDVYGIYNSFYEYMAAAGAMSYDPTALAQAASGELATANVYSMNDIIGEKMTKAEVEQAWTEFKTEFGSEWPDLKQELKEWPISDKDKIVIFESASKDKYTQKTTVYIEELGFDMNMDMTSRVVRTPMTFNVPNAVDVDTLTNGMQAIMDKYTEYVSTTIDLTYAEADEEGMILTTGVVEMAYKGAEGSNYDTHAVFMFNKDGNYYIAAESLPLLLPETTWSTPDEGRTYEWNNGQASGKILTIPQQNDPYIKVRDLTKAGYTVEYDAEANAILIS